MTSTLASAPPVVAGRVPRAEATPAWRRTFLAFEHAPIGMALLDLGGRYLEANAAMCRLLGRRVEELRDLTFVQLTHEEDRAESAAFFRDVVGGARHTYEVEKRYLRPDGTVVWGLVSATVARDDTGTPVHIVVQVQDVSARRTTEARLRETERRMASMLQIVPVGITFVAEDGTITFANDAAEKLLRLDRVTLSGRIYDDPSWHIEAPDGRPFDHDDLPFVQVASTRAPVHDVAHSIVHPDGTRAVVSVAAAPLFDVDDAFSGMVAAITDVTRQHDMQQQLERYVTTVAASRAFWQDTLDSLPSHIAVLDDEGVIIAVNDAWRTFAADNGGTDYLGMNYLDVCDAAGDPTATQVGTYLRLLLAGDQHSCTLEYPCHSPTQRRWFSMRAVRYRGEGPGRLVVEHHDITARRVAEDDARVRAALLEQIDAAVIATDFQRTITQWNSAAERLYGWTAEEVIGRDVVDVTVAPAHADAALAVLASLAPGQGWRGSFEVVRKGGSTFTAHVNDSPIINADGETTGYVGVSIDISDRIRAEQDLAAARDRLRAVTDSIGEGLCTLDASGRITYLNPAGEALLGTREAIGITLTSTLKRPDDGAANRFIAEAEHTRQAIRLDDEVLVRPDGSHLPVALTATPLSSTGAADTWVVVLTDISDRKAREAALQQEVDDLSWLGRLQAALDHDRFVLFAQPIIDIATRQVVQHELLLRLNDPVEGIVAPTEFIPAAERLDLMATIDRWVIDQSMEMATTGMRVDINLSGGSLADLGLIEHVRQALHRSGTDPADVMFEVTETDLIRNLDAAHDLLAGLQQLGCAIALDDFGTGYAGFTYLKSLPVNYLKIDREFVADLTTNQASQQVVKAVVQLARGLGHTTIAEGVEDDITLRYLADLGVDHAQGYLLGRPHRTDTNQGPATPRG